MTKAQLQILICLYNAARPLDLQDIYRQFKLGKFVPLDDMSRRETFGQEAFTHEIRSTLNVLKRTGYVNSRIRGVWEITDRPRKGMSDFDRVLDACKTTDKKTIVNAWESFI
jgi:hypothetical protein